jgi:hypothetical protein
MTSKAIAAHLAAIESGNVTKTNVIGIRKALNAAWRISRGYDGGRSNATPQDAAALLEALEKRRPIVRYKLHESGVRLITGKRYAKRLAPVADKIAALMGFSLVGFEDVGRGHHIPIYEAWGYAGKFLFRVIPWQAADALGLESGPVILESNNVD